MTIHTLDAKDLTCPLPVLRARKAMKHLTPGDILEVDATDPAAVVALARELGADLVVVGPEAPLAAGVSDALREAGFAVFGPSQAAAQLEASKAFAKEVMAAAGVPTAGSRVCTTAAEAAAALDEFGAPHVVKDDGLAAGKGVVVTSDRAEALAHAEACFAAGGTVVIEDFLDGPEVSLFVICDGEDAVALTPAQDFKRIHDGDAGPNTGGMGAYTPLPWLPEGFTDEVMDRVARPVLAEMARRGTPFVGVLYVGLALTSRGPRVIEFNVRFGDPEVQAVLARLDTPLGAEGLARAIALGDWASVRKANGVGPKLAQRVVLELKDKAPGIIAMGGALTVDAGAVLDADEPGIEPGTAAATPTPAPAKAPSSAAASADALSALTNLGYGPSEAAMAVAEASAREPGAGTAALIRAALKSLAPKE